MKLAREEAHFCAAGMKQKAFPFSHIKSLVKHHEKQTSVNREACTRGMRGLQIAVAPLSLSPETQAPRRLTPASASSSEPLPRARGWRRLRGADYNVSSLLPRRSEPAPAPTPSSPPPPPAAPPGGRRHPPMVCLLRSRSQPGTEDEVIRLDRFISPWSRKPRPAPSRGHRREPRSLGDGARSPRTQKQGPQAWEMVLPSARLPHDVSKFKVCELEVRNFDDLVVTVGESAIEARVH